MAFRGAHFRGCMGALSKVEGGQWNGGLVMDDNLESEVTPTAHALAARMGALFVPHSHQGTQTMSDKLYPVEQADRDAAAPFAFNARVSRNRVIEGKCDNDKCVQAFARHRFEASLRTPTPEQAGEVEHALQELEGSDFSFIREHAAVLRAALQSTPPAQPTADAVEREDYDAFVTFEGWINEWRYTMDGDVLRLWAIDVVDSGKRLLAIRDKVLATLPTTMAGDYVMVPDNLAWFSDQHRLSLDHYSPMYGDDDDQSVEWRVSREGGSINDREWEVVGRGETAAQAIASARAMLAASPTGGE